MDSEAVDEVAGPLLKPLGVDGAPWTAVGEWLLPFITAGGRRVRARRNNCALYVYTVTMTTTAQTTVMRTDSRVQSSCAQ